MTEEKKAPEMTEEQKAALVAAQEAQEKQKAERERVIKRLEEEFIPLFDGETLNGVANLMQGITEWANKESSKSRDGIIISFKKGDKLGF